MAYTDAALEALLFDQESDLVERKERFRGVEKKVREAICAFANDLPGHGRAGVIFVGVRDDGSCANLVISDEMLLHAANMRDDGEIRPIPSITVTKRCIRGCELLVIEVQPSATPPIRFDGRTCIRVGPRRALATPEEELRLTERMRGASVAPDLRPVAQARLADLDLGFFRDQYLPAAVAPEVLAANGRPEIDQLRSLRFLAVDGSPTVLGILVLGHDPRQFVPGAYVQFLRFDGPDLASPIRHQQEISGRVDEILRECDAVLRAHISVRTQIVGVDVERTRPDYPLAALQQLLRNAVMHRSYLDTHAPVRVNWFEDRIEIQNPGGPYGQVTVDNFGSEGITDYRNPGLAEAMKNLGFVQRFGVGLAIARGALRENGNPELEHEAVGTHVLVRLRRAP